MDASTALRASVAGRIGVLLAAAIGDDVGFAPDAHLAEDLGLGWTERIDLIEQIEGQYDITIDDAEMAAAKTVGALVDLVADTLEREESETDATNRRRAK